MPLLTLVRPGQWVVVKDRIGIAVAATPTGVVVDLCHPYFGTTVERWRNVPYEAIRQAHYREWPKWRQPPIKGNEEWLVRKGYLTEEEVRLAAGVRDKPEMTAKVEFVRTIPQELVRAWHR